MIKEIKIEKFEGLAVLVPDDAKGFVIRQNSENSDLWFRVDILSDRWIELPLDKYDILGKATDLTEEQCADIMPLIDEEEPQYGYEVFMTEEEFNRTDRVEACDSAKIAFNSYMESIGCYSINPYENSIDFSLATEEEISEVRTKLLEADKNTGTWLILKKL